MNVGLNFLGGLNLDNQVYIRNIKSTRGNICCDKNLEFTLFESLHRDFSLVLSNITVHHFNILFDFVRQDQSISVCFCRSKNNCLALAAIAYKNISQSRDSILVRAADSQVLDCPCRLVFEIKSKIDESSVLLHIEVAHISHPAWNCG